LHEPTNGNDAYALNMVSLTNERSTKECVSLHWQTFCR